MRLSGAARFALAAFLAALAGSLLFGAAAAVDSAGSDQPLLSPGESFRAVFSVSFALAVPTVAAALALFRPVAARLAPPGTPHRARRVLGIGAAGGIAIGAAFALLLFGAGPWWLPVVIGLGYGLPAAVAGLLLLSPERPAR